MNGWSDREAVSAQLKLSVGRDAVLVPLPYIWSLYVQFFLNCFKRRKSIADCTQCLKRRRRPTTQTMLVYAFIVSKRFSEDMLYLVFFLFQMIGKPFSTEQVPLRWLIRVVCGVWRAWR